MSKKPTPKENKKYTAQFKSEAIKLAERLRVAEAAEKLGIYASQIYSWLSALNNSRTGVERESLLAAENARLKRQLVEQAEELEILKRRLPTSRSIKNKTLRIYSDKQRAIFNRDDGARSVSFTKWVLQLA